MARFTYVTHLGNTPGHLKHWSSREFVGLVSKYFEVVEVKKPIPWTMVLARKISAKTAEPKTHGRDTKSSK